MITTINEFKVNENASANTYFQSLFTLRQTAHDLHLTRTKYDKHMALGEFYESLLPLIDIIFETYQGQYGLLEDYKTVIDYDYKDQEVVTVIEALTKQIKSSGDELLKEDSHLLSIADDIIVLCYHTLYKLKHL